MEAVLRLGKDFADELPQPPVKLAARRAAGLGEDEASLVDVTPQPRSGVGAQVEGILAGEPEHGRLLKVVERGVRRIEHVPGKTGGIVLLPLGLHVLDEVGDVVPVSIPVAGRGVAALGDDHWAASLGEKEQREARRHDGVFDRPGAERTRERILRLHEHPRALEIPVGLADESPRCEPPHPLEAIEIVVVPCPTTARVFEHGELLAKPVEPAVDHLGRRAAAAAGDRLPVGHGRRSADVLGRDPHARDSRAGHAA